MLCFIWENSVLNENRLAVKMLDQSAVLFLGKILEALYDFPYQSYHYIRIYFFDKQLDFLALDSKVNNILFGCI